MVLFSILYLEKYDSSERELLKQHINNIEDLVDLKKSYFNHGCRILFIRIKANIRKKRYKLHNLDYHQAHITMKSHK